MMDYGIIAAGNGSRLAQEGSERPKPLVEIGGEPMIGRLMGIFFRSGAERLSVVINESMTQVRRYLESLDLPVDVTLTVKNTKGSLHSLSEACKWIRSEKFCIATVDSVFDEREFKAYVKAFEADDGYDGYMAVTSFIDDEKPLYVDVDEKMEIKTFRDRPWAGAEYVSGGVYCLGQKALGVLRDSLDKGIDDMSDYQRALVQGGLRLKACPFDKIIDVDHLHDVETANQYIKQLQANG